MNPAQKPFPLGCPATAAMVVCFFASGLLAKVLQTESSPTHSVADWPFSTPADFKRRGLLDETLVVRASEMGRSSFVNGTADDKVGRDHNGHALCVRMARGDTEGGATAGATDIPGNVLIQIIA